MDQALSEIVAKKESAEERLFRLPGVTGVDVGFKYVGGKRTDEVAIRVMVAKKDPSIPAKNRVPAEIDGVKTDVIERTYFLQDDVRNRRKVDDVTLDADAGNYSTVKGGIGIGPCRVVGGYVYVGTLGAIVKDNATGNPLLLSNFHVMCIDNGWHVGDTMAQPGRVDGGTCPANVVGTLQRAQLTAQVDCAVSSLSGRGYSCEIVDIGNVAGTATATLNAPVRKRGRTTGLTYGFVDSISLSVNIDYGSTLGTRTLTNQIGIRPDTAHNAAFGDHGDSGSAVVDGSVHVVGLHFAGSSDGHGIANPIAAVLSALGVSMCTGSTKNLLKDTKDLHKEIEKLPIKDVRDHKLLKSEIKELEKLPVKDARDIKSIAKEVSETVKITDVSNPIAPVNGPQVKATDNKLQKDTKDKDKEKLELPEQKQHKDSKDTKDHKEQKEHKDSKENKDQKDGKEHKDQKEHKDTKDHKSEIKEHKVEIKDHKVEFKEVDKTVFDQVDPKSIAETGPFQPGQPVEGGGFEARMQQLEAAVAQLSTFITADLRPDLGGGALTNEKDDRPCNC